MTRLLRAELLRLRSRRLTWLALAAVLLVVALSQLAVASQVRPITAAERAQAQAGYAAAVRDYQQHADEYRQECLDSGGSTEDCTVSPPTLEDYVPRTISTFRDAGVLVVTVTVAFAGLALLLLSASFVGAEFTTGSMANWLTFVPERGRVFAAKLLALALAAAVGTAAVTTVAVGVAALVAHLVGGQVVGLGHVAATGGRGVVVGVLAAVLGFGLALLTRHTIAAAAVVLGYLIASGVLGVFYLAVPALQRVQRYLPENNVLAVLNGRHTFYSFVERQQPDGTFSTEQTEHLITLTQASVYWAAVVVVLLAAAYLLFRRRDVT